MNEKVRKFISGIIVGAIIFGSISFYAELTRAVNPAPSYVYPSDGATFVPVWRGHGVNITVNVSDGDGDLQQVILKWNNSGTWATFYDSGALGGVSYHNVTVLNTNFTGSWTTYEWQVCAKDSSVWANTTYNFTTEYVWGDPNVVVIDDYHDLLYPSIIKNNTNDYWVAWVNWDTYYVDTMHSTSLKFVNEPIIVAESDTRNDGSFNINTIAYLYKYNGKCYIAYIDDYGGSNSYYAHYYTEYWNGSAWIGKYNTGIVGGYKATNAGTGAYTFYYNGEWQTFVESCYVNEDYKNYPALYWYHGSSPFSGSSTKIENYGASDKKYNFYPSTAILEGKLILVYRDNNDDLHWRSYDGATWTDKGTIELDIGDYGCSVIKDPINNRLILIYVNATGNIYYRILTDPDGTWSEPHLLFTPESGKTVKHPYAKFIDHRIVVVFSYNLRGNYNIYMITAPEYLSSASGILKQYNRIQFPDSTPNQKNVNSSVFYFENINSRAINWINWSFSDIGSIQCENNIRLWGSTDNSSWTAIGTTDANGYINMTSTAWAGGLPWQAGEIRYFKIELLDVGSVPEDLHSNDEGIILKVGLA